MEYRYCGKTDLKLSIMGTGCWAFGGGDYWGFQDQRDVNAVVKRSIELGINYFDTAEVYNQGRSEESLGNAIKDVPRDKIIIGSKVSPSNAYYNTLIDHCEASLKRAKTDYFDLYMIHWPIHPHSIRHFTEDKGIINNPPKIDEAIEALNKLKEQGKIRYIGVSNYGSERLDRLIKKGLEVIVNELPYNLLSRAIEYDIIPYCEKMKIGIIGYMVLMQGILAGIYSSLDEIPAWQSRTRHFNSSKNDLCRHGEYGAEEETEETLRLIRKLADDNNMTMSEISIKWAISNTNITTSLVGTRNINDLESNVKIIENPLSEDIINKLNKITFKLKEKLGLSFDYYESIENNRTI